MKQFKKQLLTASAIVGLASALSAQIAVTNNTGGTITVDSGADQTNKTTTFSSWSLSGGNTVAVFFSGEGQDLTSATFGGETLSIVQATDGVRHSAAIAYLINPSITSGDIVLNWADSPGGTAGQNEIGYTPFALGNVGSVITSDANDSGGLNFAYTTTLNGGYVLGNATNNNFDGPAPSFSGDNFDTTEYNSSISGNFSTVHVHGDVPLAGSYSETLGGDSSAAIAFEAVPEPSAFALLAGCFGLTWVMLRRRA